jgi:hypothetical protein
MISTSFNIRSFSTERTVSSLEEFHCRPAGIVMDQYYICEWHDKQTLISTDVMANERLISMDRCVQHENVMIAANH